MQGGLLVRRGRSLALATLVAAVAVAATAGTAAAATYPTGFTEVTLPFTGLSQPMAARFAPDGSIFVAEKNGRVKRFTNLATANAGQVVIDLGPKVHNYADRGLLGLAVDPNYSVTRRIFVLYTAEEALPGTRPNLPAGSTWNDDCPNPPGGTGSGCVVAGKLSKVTLDPATSVGTEQELIHDWCQQFPSHSIGTVEFGPDGFLYAGGGDGASYNTVDYGQLGGGGGANAPENPCGDPMSFPGAGTDPIKLTAEGGALRAQDVLTASDPTTLDGTIIRVSPESGLAAPGNPLGGDANRSRIIAHGLRNPFRFSFRPGTDELWAGDVGWSTFEELNRVADVNDATVENFGWPCYEGAGAQGGYNTSTLAMCANLAAGQITRPYHPYRHGQPVANESTACPTGSGSSTAGVRFYSGDGSYPSSYDGGMFFADYSRKCMWFMPRSTTTGDPDVGARFAFGQGLIAPVDMQIGPGGDVYYVDAAGAIRRIVYTPGNAAPVARITTQAPFDNPNGNAPPLRVDLDGTTSSDAEGDALAYAWDLDGDGAFDDSTAADPGAWDYTTSGTFTVRLRVTDAIGKSSTEQLVVRTNNTPPVPQITITEGQPWAVGDRIGFTGSAVDAQEGSVPASRMRWVVTQEHCVTAGSCHTHPVREIDATATGTFFGTDHPFPSFHRVRLEVEDATGLKAATSVEVTPKEARLSVVGQVGGVPAAGLEVRLNGQDTRGLNPTSVIGNSLNQLFAPSPQAVGPDVFHFHHWSTGATDPSADYTAPLGAPVAAAEFDQAPRALAAPVIAGRTQVGSTLTADAGTWAGFPAPAASRAWQRCDAAATACQDLPGQTGAAYALTAADAGARLRVVVTADNRTPEPAATVTATSDVVSDRDGRAPVLALSGPLSQRALRQKAIWVWARCPQESCRVLARTTLSLPRTSGASRAHRLRSGEKAIRAGARAKLVIKLARRDRSALARVLRRRSSVTARVLVTATDAAGNRSTARRTIRLRR